MWLNGPRLELKYCLQLVPVATADPVFLLPKPETFNSQKITWCVTVGRCHNWINIELFHHLFQEALRVCYKQTEVISLYGGGLLKSQTCFCVHARLDWTRVYSHLSCAEGRRGCRRGCRSCSGVSRAEMRCLSGPVSVSTCCSEAEERWRFYFSTDMLVPVCALCRAGWDLSFLSLSFSTACCFASAQPFTQLLSEERLEVFPSCFLSSTRLLSDSHVAVLRVSAACRINRVLRSYALRWSSCWYSQVTLVNVSI